MNDQQIKDLVAGAIRAERMRSAKQLAALLDERYKKTTQGRELAAFNDKPLTYWDLRMIAQEMKFKQFGTDELPSK